MKRLPTPDPLHCYRFRSIAIASRNDMGAKTYNLQLPAWIAWGGIPNVQTCSNTATSCCFFCPAFWFLVCWKEIIGSRSKLHRNPSWLWKKTHGFVDSDVVTKYMKMVKLYQKALFNCQACLPECILPFIACTGLTQESKVWDGTNMDNFDIYIYKCIYIYLCICIYSNEIL